VVQVETLRANTSSGIAIRFPSRYLDTPVARPEEFANGASFSDSDRESRQRRISANEKEELRKRLIGRCRKGRFLNQ
jgi:hypothetical protein